MILAASPVHNALCLALTVYTFVLFVRVILSWAMLMGFRRPLPGPFRSLLELLDDVTEPVLRPLRRLIPPVRAGGIGLDLSVIVAFVILFVIRSALHC